MKEVEVNDTLMAEWEPTDLLAIHVYGTFEKILRSDHLHAKVLKVRAYTSHDGHTSIAFSIDGQQFNTRRTIPGGTLLVCKEHPLP